MQLKWPALIVTFLASYFMLTRNDRARADSSLRSFYDRMLAADFAAAHARINEAIHLWPDNSRYYTWRAYCAAQDVPPRCESKRPPPLAVATHAMADYRRALRLNPNDAVAHHNLAWIEHLAGNDQQALIGWKQALAIAPRNWLFHLSLGMFLEEKGEPSAAIHHYAAALHLSPSILDSPFFTRYAIRHPEDAKALIERVTTETRRRLSFGVDPILKARLGKFYLHTGQFARAATVLKEAAQDLPGLPLVWMNLGDVHRASGDTAQAVRCYERANLLDAGLPGPSLRLGQADLDSGNTASAADRLRKAAARWSRLRPITAAHNNRLYSGPPQQIDDLLPTTLLWYVSPCDSSVTYGLLSKLYPTNTNYSSRSRTCEDLPDPHLFEHD